MSKPLLVALALAAVGLFLFSSAGSAVGAAVTAPTWSQLTPSNHPSGNRAAFSDDAKDGYSVLFGGVSGSADVAQTWVFSAGSWTQLSPAKSPSAREAGAATYDAADGYVLMYGGFVVPNAGGSCYFDCADTWSYATGTWTNQTATTISATNTPPAVNNEYLAYDAADGYVLLFGGLYCNTNNVCTFSQQTWSYKAGTWTNLTGTVTTPPSPRAYGEMVYDSALGEVVLFGGLVGKFGGGSHDATDTWAFKSGQWTQITGLTKNPNGRDSYGMSYDSGNQSVVLFGGVNDTNGALYQDTWTFTGSWTNLSASPSPLAGSPPAARDFQSFVYDSKDGYNVLFGGYTTSWQTDTWSFQQAVSTGGGGIAPTNPLVLDIFIGMGIAAIVVVVILFMLLRRHGKS